jgi:hypothetical protein
MSNTLVGRYVDITKAELETYTRAMGIEKTPNFVGTNYRIDGVSLTPMGSSMLMNGPTMEATCQVVHKIKDFLEKNKGRDLRLVKGEQV